ncbi:MAG TPA: rRNA adenine dimethyltransferase family protein [Actinomycetota bacterium]|nr:rRNA adenine dimethyltransferase family protein [Actinomycetota bacterium]
MSGRASRRAELGQHFLAGGWLAAELVEQAGVGQDDLVVEIGAGTGVLTEALARRAGRVVAVECDPRLADRARARLAGHENARVVTADALAMPPPRRPFRVVANLPFGSTTAMLRRLLGDPRSRLERADLIVQEQAARRYAARRPGTPETIAWGAWYDLAVGRRLGPGCFRPPPRVGAAVLVARRRRPPLVPVGGHGRYTALLQTAFRHPGLPLRRGLVPPLTYRQLRRLARDPGFPLDARPGDLDAAQWAGLQAFLSNGADLGSVGRSP